MFDEFPSLTTVPPVLRMDYSRILNKPFLVGTFNWATTNTVFTPINSRVPIPSGVILNNLAKVPFNSSVYYRAKICLMLQVAGTPLHSGTLLASVMPFDTPFTTTSGLGGVHSMMCAPHVFLSANQATPACLEVPFYCTNRLALCDLTGSDPASKVPTFYGSGNDYAQLNVMVLNTLQASATASTTVTVSVHVIFQDLEFYVPHNAITYSALPTTFAAEGFASDLRTIATGAIDSTLKSVKTYTTDMFDSVREGIRQYTGLHNPNIPAIEHASYHSVRNTMNLVDEPTFYEKLDPYGQFDRFAREPLFMTRQDEMDLRFLLSKPQYISTFRVNAADTKGRLLFSRPITPLMGSNHGSNPDPEHLISLISKLSRFWRGGMKLHIQSSMSNFHFVKLLVSLNYFPSTQAITSQPNYDDLQNLLTTACEFSAGGQIQTVELPFCSEFNQLEVSLDQIVNALQHGMLYIHLMQPMVLSGNTPSDISFNVYLSCDDDFQLYGYSVNQYQPFNVARPPPLPSLKEEFVAESATSASIPDQCALEIKMKRTDESRLNAIDCRPVISIRDFVRRMYASRPVRITGDELNAAEGVYYYPVRELIGLSNVDDTLANPIEAISRMFYGFTGGLKFKFQILGATDAQIFFVPPGARGAQPTNVGAPSRFIFSGRPTPTATSYGAASATPPLLQSFIPGTVDHFPVPTIESANRNIPSSWRTTIFPSTTEYADLSDGNMITLEGTVPNMNPFKFVGNCNQFYTAATNFADPAGDLGYLVLRIQVSKILRDPVNNPGGPYSTSNVVIIPFVGLTDESRYGFQTMLAPMCSRTIPSSTGMNKTYIVPYAAVVTGQQALPAVDNAAVAGSWYTRT